MEAPGQAAVERKGRQVALDPTREVRLSIVLPAHNEEENVESAIAEATAAAERLVAGHEIVVVDDGSTDSTAARVRGLAAADPRIRLVQHDRNRGYGEALRSGFLACRLDFIFFTDADLQFDMGELELLLPYAGMVDVVAGYRINRQDTVIHEIASIITTRTPRPARADQQGPTDENPSVGRGH